MKRHPVDVFFQNPNKKRQWSDFQKACRNGETKRVKELMSAGTNLLLRTTSCGCTPLHLAVKGNVDTSVLSLFLKSGAPLDALSRSGKTPFDMAIHIHCVEWMIAFHHIDAPRSQNPFDYFFEGQTEHHSFMDALRCMYDWGERIPPSNIMWWNAIPHLFETPELWTLLASMGACFETRDAHGNTWLHHWIQTSPDISVSHVPMADSLMLTRNNNGDAPINLVMKRVSHTFPEWLARLIKDQPSILDETRDTHGESAADLRISMTSNAIPGMIRLADMVLLGWKPSVRTMIPVLRNAIEESEHRIVRVLLSLGGTRLANASMNSQGCTPLLRSLDRMFRWRNNTAGNTIVVALLQHGANLDASIRNGSTAYDIACQNGLDVDFVWDDAPASIQMTFNPCWNHAPMNPKHATLRHLWCIARLQTLWRTLKRFVRIRPYIIHYQQQFKERYYAPNGPFETNAAIHFYSMNEYKVIEVLTGKSKSKTCL